MINWIGFKFNFDDVRLIVVSVGFVSLGHVGFVIIDVMLKLAFLLVIFVESLI